MELGKHEAAAPVKKKREWSKVMTFLVVFAGFVIAQEALVLMYYCIRNEYTSTAAWLTACVGLAEVIIGAGLTGYLNLAKSDHKEGGITFESAKAADFKQDNGGNDNSPAI